ncbi:MAG: DUF423 domain-containing protein [Bacteroidetes bacterium]|nr:DUF423 domain-containing protein [Bacteroidota bacterium]
MNKSKYILAAIIMALAVVIGAFGAHALKEYMDDYAQGIFKTGSFYHFVHGLALFIVLILDDKEALKNANAIFYFFVSGIVLFSGSLYLLALKDSLLALPGIIGVLTPMGGLFFVSAWLLLAYNFFSKKSI